MPDHRRAQGSRCNRQPFTLGNPSGEMDSGHDRGLHSPRGLVPAVVGSLTLGWECFLRCAIAYVVTILAMPILPLLRRVQVLWIAAAAVLAEFLVELATAAIVGAHAGRTPQPVATGISYVAVLAAARRLLRVNFALEPV
jgi:hypothetical protein